MAPAPRAHTLAGMAERVADFGGVTAESPADTGTSRAADAGPPASPATLGAEQVATGSGWISRFSERLPQTKAAVAYAQRGHAGQRQGDGTPYLLHPLEVASLLQIAGAPDHLIAAGVLHDVLEKTDASESDLRRRFGAQITNLVLAVSDDDRITGYGHRKAALRKQVARAGDEAAALFAADKLSKLRELRHETALDGQGSGATGRIRSLRARRLRHYQRSLAMLEDRAPELSLVRDLHEELEAFLRECATITATI
jgi:hypothetical protein